MLFSLDSGYQKKLKIFVSSFEDQHIFILDLKSNLHQLAASQLTGTLK